MPIVVGTLGSAGGVGTSDIVPGMPPNLIHSHLVAPRRHRVDTLRRAIHSLGIEKALVFMNYQQRLQVLRAEKPYMLC